MKRILQVMSSLHGNGTETAVMNIYRSIDRSECQFDFLIFDDENMDFYDEIRKMGGNIYILPSRRKNLWGYLSGSLGLFRRNSRRYDVIHLNFCYLSLLWPFLLAKLYGIPKRIIHSHSSNYVGSRLNLYLHRLFRRMDIALSNEYIACSKEAGDWFYSGTKAHAKCRVIPNGINLSSFVHNPDVRKQYRENLNLKDELVLGQIGYFSPVKNHKFSIDLIKSLRKSMPGVKLLFIGKGGDNEDEIREMVKDSGLENNIIFLGYRTDINNIFQALDILIHPSLFEGLPLSLVEAQASGLKVITSDNVSRDSKFTDNIDFLPIDKGVEIWIEKINRWAKYDRSDISAQIHNTPFNIDQTTRQICSIYNLEHKSNKVSI